MNARTRHLPALPATPAATGESYPGCEQLHRAEPTDGPGDLNADETIDARECAHLLHCSVQRIEDMAVAGDLPALKIGRSWIFLRADLLIFLAQRAREEAAHRRSKRVPLPSGSVLLAGLAIPPRTRRKVPPALPPLPGNKSKP